MELQSSGQPGFCNKTLYHLKGTCGLCWAVPGPQFWLVPAFPLCPQPHGFLLPQTPIPPSSSSYPLIYVFSILIPHLPSSPLISSPSTSPLLSSISLSSLPVSLLLPFWQCRPHGVLVLPLAHLALSPLTFWPLLQHWVDLGDLFQGQSVSLGPWSCHEVSWSVSAPP